MPVDDERILYKYVVDDNWVVDKGKWHEDDGHLNYNNKIEHSLLSLIAEEETSKPDAIPAEVKLDLELPDIEEFLADWKREVEWKKSRPQAKQQTAPPIDTNDDALAIIHHHRIISAWRLWEEGEVEDCYKNCRAVLEYPEASELHKALCHYMLAHSDVEFLEHANQAVDLLETLYVKRQGGAWHGERPPTEKEEAHRVALLKLAQDAQFKAKVDNERVEEDYQEQVEKYIAYHQAHSTKTELASAFLAEFADVLNDQDSDEIGTALEKATMEADVDMQDFD